MIGSERSMRVFSEQNSQTLRSKYYGMGLFLLIQNISVMHKNKTVCLKRSLKKSLLESTGYSLGGTTCDGYKTQYFPDLCLTD